MHGPILIGALRVHMAGIKEFRSHTNTKARRHTFYCYCTKEFIQDQAIFFLLVEAYRESRLKRQALFLTDWFIKGNIPAVLQEGGYVGIVNISSSLQTTVSDRANNAVAAVGRTFSDKMEKHGGGVGGFFGALRQKIGDTKVSADIFDTPCAQVVSMLDDAGKHGFGGVDGTGATYAPDATYQPFGAFAHQVPIFRKHLKTAGFDPDQLGIY